MSLRGQPTFWVLWSAATVSGFGDYVTLIALRLLVLNTLHDGATAVGLVDAARWVPYLLFGLVAGVLVERVRRHPLLVATDLGRAVLLGLIPLMAALGDLTLGRLMAVVALYGLLSLVNDAADVSLLPRVLPARLLSLANARLDQSDAVALTAGPALAGTLVALTGAANTILLDVASFLASGLVLLRIRPVEPPARRASLRGVPVEAREGLRFVYTHPTLGPYAIVSHAWFVLNAATGAIVLPLAERTLHLGVLGIGFALAAAGVGGLVGSSVGVRLAAVIGVGRADVVAYALTGLAWVLIGLAPASPVGWTLFGVGQLLYGLGLTTSNAATTGYRQAATPDRLQARMGTTIRSVNRAMIVVGAPVGGALADLLGYRAVLLGCAAGFLVLAAALRPTSFWHAKFGDAYTPLP